MKERIDCGKTRESNEEEITFPDAKNSNLMWRLAFLNLNAEGEFFFLISFSCLGCACGGGFFF